MRFLIDFGITTLPTHVPYNGISNIKRPEIARNSLQFRFSPARWAYCCFREVRSIYVSVRRLAAIPSRNWRRRLKVLIIVNNLRRDEWYFDSADVILLRTAYIICSEIEETPCNNIPDNVWLLASVCIWVTAALGLYMLTMDSLHKASRNAVKAFSCSCDQLSGTFLPVNCVKGATICVYPL